ncbi:MAG: hypothetical protein LBT20_05875 [Clostridiales bacterium]|jgi:hypothetical protein|nr:hypothetical protein [Clostridiales bacterium]
MAWFNELAGAEQVFFIIAVIASIFLVLQLVLLLFGIGNNDSFDGGGEFHFDGDACTDATGADGDFSGHDGDGVDDIQSNENSITTIGGLKIVTVRGIIAFFAVGGWTAFALFDDIGYFSLLAGAAAGIATAVVIALILREMMKLERSGTLSYKKSVGSTATVYLGIPPKREGEGKINLIIQGRYMDCSAVTDEREKIEVGATVKIIGLKDENTFIVERAK